MSLDKLETLLADMKKKIYTDDGELKNDVKIEWVESYKSLLDEIEEKKNRKKRRSQIRRLFGR